MPFEASKSYLARSGAFYDPEPVPEAEIADKRTVFLSRVRDEIAPLIDPEKSISRETMWQFLACAFLGETIDGKPVSVRFLNETDMAQKVLGLQKEEYASLKDRGDSPWEILFVRNTLYFGKRN